ncbi:NADH oxidoreductase [Campylobacter sp. RM12327]|uniref:NADH-ubiquinone oxidoreductase subunit E family protein n=1 Tax=Campylobacter sputorum TaxID=206 RepID=UPI00053BE6D8|nr:MULTISPECIES: NADH-ubiquinone oxidoreductase subunit E family protein [Campylobacter]ASM40800.1 NADH:quinone oxidoreductase I, chain E [Campylobacter sputorum]MBE7357892.1 NADH oxidoreductase [Campylobacter sp. RM11302]MBF6669681.1 NADH oxidoreductase [Campylobacter sp. RM12327]MBF6674824.1 NADH oxidoreductase [Campylobacter sp. RM13538]MBF6675738.1 NADH oxidoreductase [Campylobacter sp. RM12321]
MKRYDLRNHKDNTLNRLKELLDMMKSDEVAIFMFEINDFSIVESSAKIVKEFGCELMNSLKFNQVDWQIVVKKV